MRIRRMIGIGALGIVGLFVLGGMVLPRTFSAKRSKAVNAPLERVYALAADFTKHPLWNARAARDATMKFSFPGSVHAGVGAVCEWTSEHSDSGSLTITAAEPNKSLTIHVVLKDKGDGEARWEFAARGAQTEVTRSFQGDIPVPVLGPWILLFLHPQDQLGRDFEQELAVFGKTAEGAVQAK